MRALSLLRSAAVLGLASARVLAGQTSPAAPQVVSDELRFTSITAGGTHSCGLTAEGRAYCWGRNDVGQLGDSTTTDRPTPVPVVGGILFRFITAGAHHTCGISTDYDAPYCWGGNESGQLGNGGKTNLPYPFAIAGGLRFALMAAGARHTCATQVHWDKQDRVVCWGSNAGGQLGSIEADDASLPTESFGVIKYASVATGDQHTCGATKQGKLFCWGDNDRGQLGNASATRSFVPFPSRINRRVTFVSTVAGTAHTCALTSAGEIFCWGENGAGQTGNGKAGRVLSPVMLQDTGFTALTAGGDVTCGLRRDGSASCWGSNAAGQFGTADAPGSRVPAPAFPGTTFKAISLGRTHGCGIRSDGTAVCWGRLEGS